MNQFLQKFETDEVGRESMSENAILPSHDSLSDHDLHWEMNYHEAAIFLEVSMRNTFPNNSNLSLRTRCWVFYAKNYL